MSSNSWFLAQIEVKVMFSFKIKVKGGKECALPIIVHVNKKHKYEI